MMHSNPKQKNLFLLILGVGAIPTIVMVAHDFKVPTAYLIPLVITLGIFVGTLALWAYANREANGTEWWQDDDASGWRGY